VDFAQCNHRVGARAQHRATRDEVAERPQGERDRAELQHVDVQAAAEAAMVAPRLYHVAERRAPCEAARVRVHLDRGRARPDREIFGAGCHQVHPPEQIALGLVAKAGVATAGVAKRHSGEKAAQVVARRGHEQHRRHRGAAESAELFEVHPAVVHRRVAGKLGRDQDDLVGAGGGQEKKAGARIYQVPQQLH